MLRTLKIPFTGIIRDAEDEPFRYIFDLPNKRYIKVFFQHTVDLDNQESVIEDITDTLNLGVQDTLGVFADLNRASESRVSLNINSKLFAVSEDCELQSFPLYAAFYSPMEPVVNDVYIGQFLIVVYKD